MGFSVFTSILVHSFSVIINHHSSVNIPLGLLDKTEQRQRQQHGVCFCVCTLPYIISFLSLFVYFHPQQHGLIVRDQKDTLPSSNLVDGERKRLVVLCVWRYRSFV